MIGDVVKTCLKCLAVAVKSLDGKILHYIKNRFLNLIYIKSAKDRKLKIILLNRAGTVPDPLKGTKSTGLRPRASRGLAPQGALTGLLRFLEEGKGKTEKEEKQGEKKRKRGKMERKKG